MNQKLFEEFYRTHFDKVVNRLRKAHLIKEDSQDLAQNIFLEIFARYNDDYLTKEGLFWWFVNRRLYDFISSRDVKKTYQKYWANHGKEEAKFFEWFEGRQEFLQGLLEDKRDYGEVKIKDAISFVLQNGLYATKRKYGKRWQKIINFIGGER